MNLAPWKYRAILSGSDESPLKRLSKSELISQDAQSKFEVYAYLKDELVTNRCRHELYGSADGTGSDSLLSVATYKAISESLERWAFYDAVRRGIGAEHGFDIDPTSSGMAAYPGLFKKDAREKAFLEAVERWALKHWWEGVLCHEVIEHKSDLIINILIPWSRIWVVILVRNSDKFSNYGFAAGYSINETYQKALVELERNARVLTKFYRKLQTETSGPNFSTTEIKNVFEKRLVFFSTEAGREHFLKRVSTDVKKLSFQSVPPKCIVDNEIVGPWTRYAFIWRVLFSGCANAHLNDSQDYFFF